MNATRFDALIVGAGPAGSSAAALLARAGWSVAIVEKQAFPRRKVCGECVAASNLPLLEALGISPAVLSFHLKELTNAGLVSQQRDGRNLIYRAAYEQMNGVLAYLTAHCCQGEACLVTRAGTSARC